jgi:hypothetical protein
MSTTTPPAAETAFDYGAPADLYFPMSMGRRGGIDYRRFRSAALALGYAFETLTGAKLAAAALEVDGVRYDAAAMRQLYDAEAYPLER